MSEELKKYAFPPPIGWFISTVIFGGLLILFIISAIAGNDVELFGAFVFIGGLVISILFALNNLNRTKKILEDESLCLRLDMDFAKATPMRRDRVRFGDEWIFIKGNRMPVRYEEITRVYQYIHRTNFIENERALKYVDSKGKHKKLCNLELRDKSKDEMLKMVEIICTKNPSVQLGYR